MPPERQSPGDVKVLLAKVSSLEQRVAQLESENNAETGTRGRVMLLEQKFKAACEDVEELLDVVRDGRSGMPGLIMLAQGLLNGQRDDRIAIARLRRRVSRNTRLIDGMDTARLMSRSRFYFGLAAAITAGLGVLASLAREVVQAFGKGAQ